MPLLLTYQNSNFRHHIEYSLTALFRLIFQDFLVIPYEQLKSTALSTDTLIISYGKNKPTCISKFNIHIYESILFSEQYLHLTSLPQKPLTLNTGIPILYHASQQITGNIKKDKHSLETSFDLVASVFFMLSQYEEVISPHFDQHGRISAHSSLAYREHFLARPIVNEYALLIKQWIIDIGFPISSLLQPNNRFNVCLTHDIDQLSKYPLIRSVTKAASLLVRGQKNQFTEYSTQLWNVLAKKKLDPYKNIKTILSLEKEYGVRSTFLFLVNNEYNNKFNYDISSPYVRQQISSLLSTNNEIALHGSPKASRESSVLLHQKIKLEQIVGRKTTSNRYHFLQFNPTITPGILEKAKIEIDSTVGYFDHEGFRAGICTPYYLFDLGRGQATSVLEVPLIIMDCTLERPQYRGLSLQDSKTISQQYIKTVSSYNGCCSILWHNTYFVEGDFTGYTDLYRDIICMIKNQRGSTITLREAHQQYS
ncbi:MAG: polysaccharide deacetylase family protein [Patescibacteria group bacterium]